MDKDGNESYIKCALMLPHEYRSALARVGQLDALMEKDDLDCLSARHLQKCEEDAAEPLIPLGIWGDGVPCNWDRTFGVEAFSLNFPGQTDEHKNLRGGSRQQRRHLTYPSTAHASFLLLAKRHVSC